MNAVVTATAYGYEVSEADLAAVERVEARYLIAEREYRNALLALRQIEDAIREKYQS